jgi:DNA-binding transcriptional LysR family regulator
MELMQLEMLVAAVEEGSLHRAAERVFRTQPAVTMAMHKLEEELGAPLFDRSNRTDQALTETGRLMYEYAKRILGVRDEALSAVAETHSLQRGRVRIGANESTSLYLLPKIILSFREQYPAIKVEVTRQPPGRLPRELREGDLDVAILSFVPEASDLEATPIVRDGLVLVVSPDHRLAGRSRIQIRELGSEPVIAPRRSSGSRKALTEAFRRAQTPLNIAVENCSFETIKRLAAVNAGVGFVSRMCLQTELARGELVVLPVEGFNHERTLWAVRRRSHAHSHAAKAFFKLIDSVSEKPATGEVAHC